MAKHPVRTRTPALLRKAGHAVRGLLYAIRHDASVATILPVSAVVVVASIVLSRWVDLVLVSVVTVQALAAELYNTALERLCDYVEPRHEPRIGAIKDIASSAVGVTILVWAAVVIYEYVNFILILARGGARG